jgi:hypothetical protein
MKSFFFIALCLCALFSPAQKKTVDVTTGNVNAMSPSFFNVVGGEPIVSVKFARLVEGTAFFKDEWMKGDVVLTGERQYHGIYLKLDLYDNEVHFQDQKGNEMIATSLIQKLILFDTTAQQVFNFINGEFIRANGHVKGWYQLLSDGKASLFKKINKQIHEVKQYGSATVEQSIISLPRYYILYNGTFTEIKKLKDLPNILVDKKEEIAQYIKSHNLSGKTDSDFEIILNYYNGLK